MIKENINKNINTTTNILVEKRLDKHTGLLKGVTPNYLNVIIEDKMCTFYPNLTKTEGFFIGRMIRK